MRAEDIDSIEAKKLDEMAARMKAMEAEAWERGLVIVKFSARRFIVVRIIGPVPSGESHVLAGELYCGPASMEVCQHMIRNARVGD